MKLKITDKNTVKIDNDMFGLFFEDINYGLDGGLYAEMLENRNFEAMITFGKQDDYHSVYDGGYAWDLYEGKGKGSVLYLDSQEPLNTVNPHYLVFSSAGKDASFCNKAYDGIYMEKDKTYQVSFYAKVLEEDADVKIAVKKAGMCIAEETVILEKTCKDSEKNGWKKYSCVLKPEADVEEADFTVSLSKKAVVAFDQFSMMPSDAVCGLFRKDLTELLAELKPSFIRFPGGCVIEGNTLANRYQWKKSIGPVEERKFNWNRWALHEVKEEQGNCGIYSHYGQTLGVGYYEYFLLCEYLGAKALPVLSVGLACQYMSSEQVAVDSEEMEEYIQDALDLIAFANEDENGEWGKIRAQMGHPEPFCLEYLGIGNEQWQTEEVDFFSRYEMFEQRIHEKYPEIKLIGSAGPDVGTERYEKAWEFYRKQNKENFAWAIDEHYYVKPEWLYENTHFYDDYDRSVKVFAGEYACHIPGYAAKMNSPEANTLEAALAEAAFLTGVERNSDLVILASYAPLFARIGYTQWSPDMIWFNGKDSYGTPSYYVQQMFSCNRGVRTLAVDWSLQDEQEERVYLNAVINEEEEIILKIVNADSVDKEWCISDGELPDDYKKTDIQVIELSGNPEEYNSITERNKIIPKSYTTSGKVCLKANSFTVLRFQKKSE